MVKTNSIFIAFSDLPDPRKPRNQTYCLFDLITISILAVLCGAEDWVTISMWTEANLLWLQQQGICESGAPSHDTLSRFFRYVNPAEFEKKFISWTQMVAKCVRGVVAIDGKTIKNSCDLAGENGAIHIVSAFATENQLILGQVATDKKSNEITAIPKLLAMLDLGGTIITIDAAGCQKEIAKKIREGKGDYLLALKGNQGKLHDEVENFFLQALAVEPQDAGCDYAVSEERSRGRFEKRETWVTQNLDWLPQKEEWQDLQSIACVRSTRVIKDHASTELRFYISSLSEDAGGILRAVRAHWGVENKLHWQLDVSYGEDKCKVRKDHGAENLSVLRRCTMNILKHDTATKAGIKNRRAKAGWDRSYMLKLLEGV
jgi:predicted transposase YbfD/YdcC